MYLITLKHDVINWGLIKTIYFVENKHLSMRKLPVTK